MARLEFEKEETESTQVAGAPTELNVARSHTRIFLDDDELPLDYLRHIVLNWNEETSYEEWKDAPKPKKDKRRAKKGK